MVRPVHEGQPESKLEKMIKTQSVMGVYGDKLLPEGSSLLEIKIPGIMPMWMSRILSELKIYPASFSKYGTYYSRTPELYRSMLHHSGLLDDGEEK